MTNCARRALVWVARGGRIREVWQGMRVCARCGHTVWLAACTASSSAARVIFGDLLKLSMVASERDDHTVTCVCRPKASKETL